MRDDTNANASIDAAYGKVKDDIVYGGDPNAEVVVVDGEAGAETVEGVDFGINVQQPVLSISPKVMAQAKNMNREQRRKFMKDVRRQFKETRKKMGNIAAHAQAKAKEAPAIAEEPNV